MSQLKLLCGCALFILYDIIVFPIWFFSDSFIENTINEEGGIKYSRVVLFSVIIFLEGWATISEVVITADVRGFTIDRIALIGVALFNTIVHLFQYYLCTLKSKKVELKERAEKYKKIWNYGCIVFAFLMLVCAFVPINDVLNAPIIGIILVVVFCIHKIGGLLYNLRIADKFKLSMRKELGKCELQKMSTLDSKVYCQYKRKIQIKKFLKNVLTIALCATCLFLLAFAYLDGMVLKYILIFIVIVMAGVLVIALPRTIYEVIGIRKSSVLGCEYTRTSIEYESSIRFVCTNKSEVSYTSIWDEGEYIFIYLPAIRKVFKEKIEVIGEIISIPRDKSEIYNFPIQGNVDEEKSTERFENDILLDVKTNILKKMNMEQTRKYHEYRYAKDKKQNILLLGMAFLSLAMLLMLCFFAGEIINSQFLLLLSIGIAIGMFLYFLLSQIQLKKMKSAVDIPYEYMFDITRLNQERVLLRENGEEIKYELQSGRRSNFGENEEVIVVYIPQCRRIYVEKKKDWEKLFSK